MSQQPSHDLPRLASVTTAAEARHALPLERILQDWPGALARVTAYLTAVGLAPAEIPRLAAGALERALGRKTSASAVSDAIDETEHLLVATHPLTSIEPAHDEREAFARWRLAAWLAGGVDGCGGRSLELPSLTPTPPLLRAPMVPARYRGRRLGESRRHHGHAEPDPERERPARSERRTARDPWASHGQWRRSLLALLVLGPSVAAGAAFLATLPATVWPPAEYAMAIAFGALFGWISVGFWTAVFGFVLLLRRGDRFTITRGAPEFPDPKIDPAARTAVVMPVRDEPVERVFAGLRAVRASLERAGAIAAFDLFVLSDTADPDVWVDEEEAWGRWNRDAEQVLEAGSARLRSRQATTSPDELARSEASPPARSEAKPSEDRTGGASEDQQQVLEAGSARLRSRQATPSPDELARSEASPPARSEAKPSEDRTGGASEDQQASGIFYRRRRVHRKRKSGNVADFCRRFGRRYRYMVVLDADSVMSGECLVRLVGMMERNPHVGIIQTAPRVVRARSLFARIQQFASRLYGPMFAAGMHYWQLGDSPYWGHNAILRVEPFMQHCGLPRLSGKPPFGGDIMSHDFVEAALFGRARWSIWLAYDLPGSYEETPGSLLEEMQRDRRWCQGNLQHLRLLFTEGVVRAHRALFLNGIFSYVSAVLWLGFLVASTVEAALWSLWGPDYFPTGRSLFPTWPVWRPERAEMLFSAVFTVLLLPKLLAVVLALVQGRAAGFGGAFALLRSVLLEAVVTALLAPIRMLFYCRFVLKNLIGRTVTWRAGGDDLGETGWWTALRRHGPDTLIACAWGYAVRILHPEAFWWLVPVAGALVLSVPLSVLASRARVGALARAAGLFVTPEETAPPAEIRDLETALAHESAVAAAQPAGFTRAIVDPGTNALHTALLRGPRSLLPRLREERSALAARALDAGPDALSRAEKQLVLSDALCMQSLHERVWRLADPDAAARWGLRPA